MDKITLEGMRFYAYHGFYKEEQVIGNYYQVDLSISTDIKKAGASDDLADTINYETLYLIVKYEMNQQSKLLEHVLYRIADSIKAQFANIRTIKLSLRKENPPLPGLVKSSMLEMELDHQKKCGKCMRPLICYNDNNCWCKKYRLHKNTQTMLKKQYKGCLCSSCLGFYAEAE